jgi:hypothetical protein
MITQMKNILVFATAINGCLIFISCSNKRDVPGEIKLKTTSFIGIMGHVFDAPGKSALSARIVIKNEDGNDIDSYYEHLPGLFTE